MPPVPAPPSNRLILPIQYLRGIAALMVTWHHAMVQHPAFEHWFGSPIGALGVDIFFVISGFIMVATTADETPPLTFWRRRIVRVVPLYWLATLAMCALAAAAPAAFRSLKLEASTLAMSLFFIPHASHSHPGTLWPLLVPGWSLNAEMFFYLVFGALLALPARGRLALLTAVLGALALAGPFVPADAPAMARAYTSPQLLEFLAGVWLGHAWRRGRIHPGPLAAGLLAVAGAALLVSMPSWPFGLAPLLGATALVAAALCPRWQDLRNAPLLALGNASYSLYLSHLFSYGALRIGLQRLLPADAGPVPSFVALTGSIAACCVAAWAVWRWIEVPLTATVGRWAAGRGR